MMRSGIRRVHGQVRDLADCMKGLSSRSNFAPYQMAVIINEVMTTLQILAKERSLTLRNESSKPYQFFRLTSADCKMPSPNLLTMSFRKHLPEDPLPLAGV